DLPGAFDQLDALHSRRIFPEAAHERSIEGPKIRRTGNFESHFRLAGNSHDRERQGRDQREPWSAARHSPPCLLLSAPSRVFSADRATPRIRESANFQETIPCSSENGKPATPRAPSCRRTRSSRSRRSDNRESAEK